MAQYLADQVTLYFCFNYANVLKQPVNLTSILLSFYQEKEVSFRKPKICSTIYQLLHPVVLSCGDVSLCEPSGHVQSFLPVTAGVGGVG